MRLTLYEHPQPLWQRFREWRTDALFQNLQLITGLLLSTGDLVQTYQEPIGYSVMFFVDAICQQYFIPILQKNQHFLSHIQSFMFSFMLSNQNIIFGKHSTIVENSIEKT